MSPTLGAIPEVNETGKIAAALTLTSLRTTGFGRRWIGLSALANLARMGRPSVWLAACRCGPAQAEREAEELCTDSYGVQGSSPRSRHSRWDLGLAT